MGKKHQRRRLYDEFLSALPERAMLRRVARKLVQGRRLSREDTKIVESSLTAFTCMRYIAERQRNTDLGRFNPVVSAMLNALAKQVTQQRPKLRRGH